MRDRDIVLDSSVIAALFFPEPYSMWAEEIVKKVETIYTVDIAYAEITNVAWKRITLLNQNQKYILQALEDAISFINEICNTAQTKKLYREAIKIAIEDRITVYDSLYVALANQKGTRLATLDKEIIKKLKQTKEPLIIHPYKQL